MRNWKVRRTVKNPRFLLTVTCQNQPFYYYYRTLIGACFGYLQAFFTDTRNGPMVLKIGEIK